MKNSPHRLKLPGGRQGFTLIEILVAIFILAIVVSMVLASFDGVFSNSGYINESSDIFELGNSALDRMTADLRAIHVMPYPRYTPADVIDDEPDIYRVEGEIRNVSGESFGWLRFTSLSHLTFSQDTREGIAEIIFYVQRSEDDQFILRRSDKLYPYPEFEESESDPVVCEQVREFKLTYYDHEGRELEEWDSDDDDLEYGTPQVIGIRLVIGTEELNFAFITRIALPVFRYEPLKR